MHRYVHGKRHLNAISHGVEQPSSSGGPQAQFDLTFKQNSKLRSTLLWLDQTQTESMRANARLERKSVLNYHLQHLDVSPMLTKRNDPNNELPFLRNKAKTVQRR